MRTLASALILSLALPFPAAWAVELGSTDDICKVRPDLCGGAKADVKSKKKKAKKKKRAQRGPTSVVEVGIEREAKCRKSGESISLAEADLPECGATDAGDSIASLEENESKRKPKKRKVSFDRYMNANANHPALGGQIRGPQAAFQEPVRTATLTAPTSSTVATESPATDASTSGGSVREGQPNN